MVGAEPDVDRSLVGHSDLAYHRWDCLVGIDAAGEDPAKKDTGFIGELPAAE